MFTRKTFRLYDKTKLDKAHLMFSNHDLYLLLLPVAIEQFLNSFMGMADTMMVSNISSAAISAVSLVDSINLLVIQIFSALAAGGTIICSQYLGREDVDGSNRAARQVTLTVTVISVTLSFLCILFNKPLLRLIFGQIEEDVMRDSITYFWITASSFPFIALFNAGSSFYRAGGQSRFPMIVSVISNFINIIGNAVFIFGFHMGVKGAALSTLLSRIFCAAVLFYYLRKPKQPIVIDHYARIKPDLALILSILKIGIPSGIENGMFQFGKLAIQSSVSTLGTAAIAAEAMTAMLESISGITAFGIGIGMMTVVGQCIGAKKYEESKYYIVKLSILSEMIVAICSIAVFAVTKPVIYLSGMEAASAKMCIEMMTAITIVKPIVWVFSFIPVYGMRAAGDVRFSMIVSTLSMWCCRVFLCIYLIRFQGFGPMAVWIGMFTDWSVRGILFSIRFLRGKWMEHEVIK